MITTESPAVAIARAHVDAWSNHDFEAARRSLAADVAVTATTTQPIMAGTSLTGVDDYMVGLRKFAEPIVAGSAKVIGAIGDDRNALLLVTVDGEMGGRRVTLPAARLYRLDDQGKISAEQVIFYAAGV